MGVWVHTTTQGATQVETAIKESRRTEALTLAEQINQNRFSGEEITSEQTVRLCELLAILLEA